MPAKTVGLCTASESRPGLHPQLRVSLMFGDSVKLGEGRAELLSAIDRLGSLKAAVEQLGMSYRNAWGYLKELEAAADFPFIDRRRSGRTRGIRLTPEGKEFLARYWKFNRRLDAVAAREFAAAFPQL